MTDEQDLKRIQHLKKFRFYIMILFVVSVVVPLSVGSILLVYFENLHNNQIGYDESFLYNYEIITGTDLTDIKLLSNEGKLFAGFLSLLKLVFFGFITTIIITTIEIKILTKYL